MIDPSTTTSATVPLAISPGCRHFVDAQGKPFFWLGDTLWHLYRSFSPADAKEILEIRKDQGFSVVLAMLIGYEPEPRPNINGDMPWIDGDPSRPNEKYYEHVDRIMEVACELGFVQVLGVYHKTQDPCYTRNRARESGRWIAARYRRVPHIVWSMYPEATTRYVATVRAITEGLHAGDGAVHMVTVHPDPSPQSSSFMHTESWLPLNMLQACVDIEQVHPMVASDYALAPLKPVVMAEGGYEGVEFGREISPADIRRQAYWTYLAGGHHVYGHNDNWQAPERWRDWIRSPGACGLSVYRRIVTSLDSWWSIVPDQSIIAEGVRSGAELNAAARSAAGDWALAYLSSPCTARIRMDRIKSSDSVDATWVDPRTGDRHAIGRFRYEDVHSFTSPDGWEDALLLLNAAPETKPF